MFLSASEIQTRLDRVTQILQGAQQFALVLTALLSTGAGGIILAWHKVRQQIKSVEENVAPVKHEVTETEPDTLRQKVEEIAASIATEQELRESQHTSNSERLDTMNRDQAAIREDIQEIHSILERLLAKMAGV